MQWIRLDECLPQTGQLVWVGRGGDCPAAMKLIFDGKNFGDHMGNFMNPTHWQPEYIPAPPKD